MFDIIKFKKSLEKVAKIEINDCTDVLLHSKRFEDKTISEAENNMICLCTWASIEALRIGYPMTTETILRRITPDDELAATLEYLKTFELATENDPALEKKIMDILIDYERPMTEKKLLGKFKIPENEVRRTIEKMVKNGVLSYSTMIDCYQQENLLIGIKY